jgi:Tol biopolymer transport system component
MHLVGQGGRRQLVALVLAAVVSLTSVAITLGLPSPGLGRVPDPYKAVTSGPWNDMQPVWSPNGQMIAFMSDRNGAWGVWVMKPDNSWNRQLSSAGSVAMYPSWSPDSSSVAFWSKQGSEAGVSVASVIDFNVQKVTSGGYSALQAQPKWSPDGRKLLFFTIGEGMQLASLEVGTREYQVIAAASGENVSANWISSTAVVYSSLVNGKYQIARADLVNGSSTVIFGGEANYLAPVVSSAGDWLAYLSDLPAPDQDAGQLYGGTYLAGDFNIWISRLDGSNATFQFGLEPVRFESQWENLFFHAAYTPGQIESKQSLAWSASGRLITYAADSPQYGTCLFLWDVFSWGSGIIGPWHSNSTQPSWSPDSVYMAYASVKAGHYHIFVVNTTNLARPLPIGT